MAVETKTQLKTYFETGDQPTQQEFENLIDSLLHVDDPGKLIIKSIKTEGLADSSSIYWEVDGTSGKAHRYLPVSAAISLPNFPVNYGMNGNVIRVDSTANAVNLNFEDITTPPTARNFWHIWHFAGNLNMNLVFPSGQLDTTGVSDQVSGDTIVSTIPGTLYVIEGNQLSGDYKVAYRILPSSGGSGATSLNQLSDVDLSGLQPNFYLQFDGTNFVPVAAPTGVTDLDDLTDVNLSNLQDGYILQYDANNNVFVAVPNNSTGVTTLGGLTDVDLTGLMDGHIIRFDANSGTFKPVSQNAAYPPIGGDQSYSNIYGSSSIKFHKNAGDFYVRALRGILDISGNTSTSFTSSLSGIVYGVSGGSGDTLIDIQPANVDSGSYWFVDVKSLTGSEKVTLRVNLTASGQFATGVFAFDESEQSDGSGFKIIEITTPGLYCVSFENNVLNRDFFIPYGGASGINSLNDLSDVDLTGNATNKILQFNGTNFVVADLPTGGTVAELNDIGNVDDSGKVDGSIIAWDQSNSEYVQKTPVDVLNDSSLTAGDKTNLKDDARYDANGIYDNTPAISVNPDYLVYNPQDVPYMYNCINGVWSRISREDTTGSGGGASSMNDLSDVDLTGNAADKILKYDGTNFVVEDLPKGFPPIQGDDTYTGIQTTTSMKFHKIGTLSYPLRIMGAISVGNNATFNTVFGESDSGKMFVFEKTGGGGSMQLNSSVMHSNSFFYLFIKDLPVSGNVQLRVDETTTSFDVSSDKYAFNVSVQTDGSSRDFIELTETGLYCIQWAAPNFRQLFFIPNAATGGGASSMNDLSDVDTSGLAVGDILEWDGTNFVPVAKPSGGGSSIFGSEFHQASDATVQTTNLDTFQQAIQLVTTSVPAGKYRVGVYCGWNGSSGSTDVELRIDVNSVQNGEIMKWEPGDNAGNHNGTGSEQRFAFQRFFYYDVASSGTQDIELFFRSELAATDVSVWDCEIEFWRVS